MKNNSLIYLFLIICFTAVGLVGGYFIFHPHTANNAASDHHAGGGADHHATDSNSIKLTAQAMENLKVKVAKVETQNFTSYKNIAAQVGETPLSKQSLRAPIKGIVKNINVTHSELVKSGSIAVSILRDAIPRPELKLVGLLLFSDHKFKGLDADSIAEMEKKDSATRQIFLWKRVLGLNGYWPEDAEALHKSLTPNMNSLSYSVALIGEIVANGYLDKELITWLTSDALARPHFFEIASLLLEGKSVVLIKSLVTSGALNSIVDVLIPDLTEDYDIQNIFVKVGDHVADGDNLLDLYNGRQLHLEANAIGSEILLLDNVFTKDLLIDAVPIGGSSSATLSKLKIQNIQSASGGFGAFVHLEINENPSVIHQDSLGKRNRTWAIRPGAKYLLRIPQDLFSEVFVVDLGAVAEDGLDKKVFIQSADSFKAVNVVELYRNDEKIILSQDSDIFPGDSIVMSGAFGLNLALKAQKSGPVSGHGGHVH